MPSSSEDAIKFFTTLRPLNITLPVSSIRISCYGITSSPYASVAYTSAPSTVLLIYLPLPSLFLLYQSYLSCLRQYIPCMSTCLGVLRMVGNFLLLLIRFGKCSTAFNFSIRLFSVNRFILCCFFVSLTPCSSRASSLCRGCYRWFILFPFSINFLRLVIPFEF